MKAHTKSHFTRIGSLLLFFLVGGLFFLSSCGDDEVAGPPKISKVRLVNPTKADSTFVQATPGTMVAIQGENLGGIINAYFNDFPAGFNPVYNTDNSLIITIPATAPTEATKADVSSKIRLVTDHGEVTYDFVLLPPPPRINFIVNENTKPGEVMTILGSDLRLISKVVFPGNQEVTNITTSEDGKSIQVTVPANLTEVGTIKIMAKFGSVESVQTINNASTAKVFNNFDDINNYSWGCKVIEDNATYPGARGKFGQMAFAEIAPNNWETWKNNRSCMLNSVKWVEESEVANSVNNYALKFEIFVKEPWKSATMMIRARDSWNYVARYEPWSVEGKVVEFSTTGWQTVTIPLTAFKTKKNGADGTGDSVQTFEQLVGNTGKASVQIAVPNNSPTTLEKFNAAIDNIRIEKIK